MSEHKSMAEQIANKCRHFNGVQNETCRAGIRYEEVRDDSTGTRRWPCFKEDGCTEQCSSVSYLSGQEVAAETERIALATAAFLTELAEGKTCPHCHKPITELYQVGRCVYNRGCGCRQYQGVVPKEKRTRADQAQIDEASLWSPLEDEEDAR